MAAYEVLLLNTAIPQIQAAQSGDTYVVPRDIAINATAIISANSATDALRITQTGAGNAILVEDSANPDSTPFVVTAAGDVGIGASSPGYALDVQKSVANGVVANFQSTSTSAVNTGVAFRSSASNAANRNWALLANSSAFGDFVIRTSTTNGGDPVSGTDRLMIDPSGNLGLGVTPSTGGYGRAFQIDHAGNGGALTAQSIDTNNYPVNLTANAVSSGATTWKYVNTDGGSASRYQQVAGIHSWYTAPSGTAGNPISFTQAMTLDASGRLGIGETNPDGMLIVKNTVGSGVLARFVQNNTGFASDVYINHISSANNFLISRRPNGEAWLYQSGAEPIAFYTNATERARITSDGDLLVGQITSGLDDSKSVTLSKQFGVVYVNHVTGQASGEQYAIFGYAAGTIGSITQNGTTGVLYNITSDYRLKDVVGAVTGAGARIDALKPVDYTWKADGSAARGFLAHEFQAVYPNSVTGTKDAVDEEGKPVYQNMQASTSEVIADLVAELQSLRARVAQLEAK